MTGHDPTGGSFDERAANYAAHVWHVQHAERLVELARLPRGATVLDVATGTGLAARAAARVVGDGGRVIGVDISPRMLDVARATTSSASTGHVTFLLGDGTNLPELGSASFDVVLCSAGLLYMPIEPALREWKRLLRPLGVIGFSTMALGAPPAAQLFRDCARELGLTLRDASQPLGSRPLCQRALEQAGFRVRDIVEGQVALTTADLKLAWEANLRTAGHEDARALSAERTQRLKDLYEGRVRDAIADGDSLRYARVLYAFGTA